MSMGIKTPLTRVTEILADETKIEYDPQIVLDFFTNYVSTGNISRSAKVAGCEYEAARYWTGCKFAEKVTAIVKVEQQTTLDRSLTGLISEVIKSLQERLDLGDYNNQGKRIPIQMDKLLKALTVLYDKRALIRGEPTSRIERVSTEQRLRKLSKRFEQLPTKTQEFIVEGLEDTEGEDDHVAH